MILIVCREQADSDDYACNQCGGDIRGLACCKYIDVYEDGKLVVSYNAKEKNDG